MNSEEIKKTYSMRDILGRYGMQPNRAGFICCPFHKEKTASMKIYQDSYYCFGCGAHGDIFDFVSQMEDITFREAFFNLGGTYEQKKETFGERMSRYHARKEWEMQQRQKENLEERRKVNSELIDIYRDCNRLVTAFLIQYHGETKAGESRGQLLTEPIKTIDTSNRYGLVTAFITKFYKSGIGQECDEPLHTITTSPGHFGLVNVVLDIEGEKYILNDIFLRMLKPEELKLMQGFPKDYIIDRDYRWKSYPITKQVARIGNSVVPIMAQKLVEANCPYLKVGERLPNFRTEEEGSGQIRFA